MISPITEQKSETVQIDTNMDMVLISQIFDVFMIIGTITIKTAFNNNPANKMIKVDGCVIVVLKN
jgi:hypothetical protein